MPSFTQIIRRTLLMTTLASVTFVPTAFAAPKDQPTSFRKLSKPTFVVVEKKGDTRVMRVKDEKLGVLGDKGTKPTGFIEFTIYELARGEIILINDLQGIPGIRGVGKALKKEVLRRYPEKELESDLVKTNYNTLMKAWGKGYPHKSNAAKANFLRKTVPALKFEGFDYIITARPRAGGGSVNLKMKRARRGSKGTIIVKNAADLDAVLVAAVPKYIPKSKRPMSAAENEDNAQDAMELAEEVADEVADDEGVDEDDLLEYLVEVLEEECGNGGSSGSGWSDECKFTVKAGKIHVTPDGGRTFRLLDLLEDEAEEFVDDNK